MSHSGDIVMSVDDVPAKTEASPVEPDIPPPNSELIANPPDVIPNGGYGWVVVFAICGMNAATWGPFRLLPPPSSLLPLPIPLNPARDLPLIPRRNQHNLRRLLGLLPREQLFLRRYHIPVRLGRRAVCRSRIALCADRQFRCEEGGF